MSTLATTNIKHPSSASNNIVLDSSARVLVGTPSASSAAATGTPYIQAVGDYQQGSMLLRNTSNDNTNCSLTIQKIRGSSIVQSGDYLGNIAFNGFDGATDRKGADIAAIVDGTPGSADMPGRLVFSTTADGASSPTERMRVDSAGRTMFSKPFDSSSKGCQIIPDDGNTGRFHAVGDGSGTGAAFFVSNASATTQYIVRPNGNVLNVNNSYGAISDVKLKENIVDATSQWSDIKALQVRKYNFKEGQTHTQIGLVAQEVELISPGLVSESPDHGPEGNDLGTVTKSVNYSVLYMKAVKALQEAMERIEQLEQRLTDAGIN